jgi:hypothetical protein
MNPSQQIDKHIKEFSDPLRNEASWRGEYLTKLRGLIHEADPEIVEEWKWSTPIFTHKKMVCAISAFKEHVKINFFKGALLKDQHKIINAGFDSKQHRAIDFHQGDKIKEAELKDLIREAVALNSI